MSILKTKLHAPDFELEVLSCVHDSSFNITKRHIHEDYYEIVLVKAGTASHTCGNQRSKIGTGDVFIMHPGQKHHYTDARNLTIFNIIFSEKFLTSILVPGPWTETVKSDLFRHGPLLLIRPSAEVLHSMVMLLEEMQLEQKRRLPDSKFHLMANLIKLLSMLKHALAETTGKDERPNIPEFRILRLVDVLNRNYAEEWPLRRMADYCGLSVNGFRRAFALAMGHSPGEWFLNLRLEKATEMLTASSRPISEIASECGFHDSNYFTRQFRRRFQITPLRFRKEPYEIWPFTKPLLK